MRKSALMTLETDKESISDLFVSSFQVSLHIWEKEREKRCGPKREKSIFSIKCWKGDKLPDNSTLWENEKLFKWLRFIVRWFALWKSWKFNFGRCNRKIHKGQSKSQNTIARLERFIVNFILIRWMRSLLVHAVA